MKKGMVSLALIFAFAGISAQYELYKEISGVQFYTKWSHEKWWSKKSPRVLLVKVVNTSDSAATYHFGLELSMNLQLVEESKDQEYCLAAKAKSMPRLKGVMFKPTASVSEYDHWELTDIDVSLVAVCEEQ